MTTMKRDFAKPGAERRQMIVSHLQEGKTVTKREIAYLCGSCIKTIQRDLCKLRNEGWPIEFVNDGCYLRAPSSAEKKGSHNKMIATLLLTGGTIDRRFSKFAPEVAQSLKRQFLKMDDVAHRRWDVELSATDAEALPFSNDDLERFGKLARHILNREPVRFFYTPIMYDEGLDREVFPVQLKERDGYWYLLGYDYDRKACRVFALPRIENPCLSVQRHEAPSEDVIGEVMSRGNFSIWDDVAAKSELVKVRLIEYAARLIQERKIHHSQKLEVISQDEVVLTLETGDMLGVSLWLRQYAPLVEVLEPKKLRDSFRCDLQAALSMYDEDYKH
jgi:predicted DNA-binding transcriptional regulator YafY